MVKIINYSVIAVCINLAYSLPVNEDLHSIRKHDQDIWYNPTTWFSNNDSTSKQGNRKKTMYEAVHTDKFKISATSDKENDFQKVDQKVANGFQYPENDISMSSRNMNFATMSDDSNGAEDSSDSLREIKITKKAWNISGKEIGLRTISVNNQNHGQSDNQNVPTHYVKTYEVGPDGEERVSIRYYRNTPQGPEYYVYE